MKKLLLILCFALMCIGARAQFVIGSTYKARSFDDIVEPYLIYQEAYNKFDAEVSQLIKYISDILGQDIDSQMRALMNAEYKKAQSISAELHSRGLSKELRARYNTVTSKVQSEVVAYNNRVAQAREAAARERAAEQARIEEESKKPKLWSGSGFALKGGYLVTNYHVVEDAAVINVKGIHGDFSTSYLATIAATDRYNDLAIIKISDPDFSGFGSIPYSIKTTTSEVGENIFVLGYPLTATMGDEIKYTTGVISSKTGFQGDVSLYQISAPIQPGNSGGPLFDSKGNIIGIVSAKHNDAENVGYAIKSLYLRNLSESSNNTSILPSTNSISSLSRTEQIKSLKKYVFLIECSSASMSYSAHSSNNWNANNSSVHNGSTMKMSISRSNLSIPVGGTAILHAYNYGPSLSWESDNTQIATVSSSGTVTGIASRSTIIWAKGNEYKMCMVTVTNSSYNNGDTPYSSNSSSDYSKTIYSKDATVKVGQRIRAIINGENITEWEVDQYRSEYVKASGKELIILRSGNVSVWGYIGKSPKLFKFHIVD